MKRVCSGLMGVALAIGIVVAGIHGWSSPVSPPMPANRSN